MKSDVKQTGGRIVIFDYLKALAIILVIINHYVRTSWRVFANSILFASVIQMAVPVFMLITGCTFAMSYNKKHCTLLQMYSHKQLISKVLRFWIPFFFAFVLEIILSTMFLNKSFSIPLMIKAFLVGGPGYNGSYYVPVLIQLIFVFPLIFTAVRNYNSKGLIICAAANFIYEILCIQIKMPSEIYRVLMPRYITFIALGVWLYFNNYKINNKIGIFMFSAGVIYIIIRFYSLFGYRKPIIFKRWNATCMLMSLYIFPIIAWTVEKFRSYAPSDTKINIIIQTVGKASFHIFLVQMIYYNIFNRYIIKMFNYPIINIPLNIFICIFVGVLFYFLEKGVSKRILSKL